MNIRAIEIMGNLLILENVISISGIFKYSDARDGFSISFKDSQKNVSITKGTSQEDTYFIIGKDMVIARICSSLEEMRDKIIKIVTTNA